jgi:polysaccharide export outer membrane protein
VDANSNMTADAGMSGDADEQRLAELAEQRTDDRFAPKFSIGPGDLLRISVEDVPELKGFEVRVSPSGTITLPVAGTMKVAGMSEDELRDALDGRLARYVKDPQVELLIQEDQSSQVAVIGMVQRPGLYTMHSSSETLLDMISRAGGLAENAGPVVLFVPASNQQVVLPKLLHAAGGANEQGHDQPGLASQDQAVSKADGSEKADTVAALKPVSTTAFGPYNNPTSVLQGADPIAISFDRLRDARLDVPARPGDLIMVPPAGEVLVQGWVATPGAYRITPGMTVLGAVTAAGGQMFSSQAKLLRAGNNGHHTVVLADLSKIQRGEDVDRTVEAGDIIIVSRSIPGAVPYLFYQLLNRFGTGAYIPF